MAFPPGTGTYYRSRKVSLIMYGRPNISMMRSFRQDPSVTHQKLKPGTVRRILTYAKPYRLWLTLFLIVTVLDALITVVTRCCCGRSSTRASWPTIWPS